MRAVNLIPAEQRSGGAVGARSQGAAFAVLALLAGVAILVFMYGSASHAVESRTAEAASLSAQAQRVQAQAASLAPYMSFVKMREQRLQEISQLVNSRFNWSGALGELSRVLPSDVSLLTLQGTIGGGSASASASSSSPASSSSASSSSSSSSSSSTAGASGSAAAPPATSATPAGSTPSFSLSGCAASQTVVAEMLVRLRLVSGVSDVTLQSSSKSGNSAAAGASGGGSGGGGCPPSAPSFAAQVSFQPLPTPPTTSTETLESSISSSGSGRAHDVSENSVGAKR